MAASKRTLAAFAAGALLVPLSPFASPAFADHIEVRSIETACPSNQLPDDPFTDVDEASTFNDEITCIAEYEVTSGKTPTTYDPAGFVIRAQMAVFIANILEAAGEELDTSDAGFTDIGFLGQGQRDAINGLANAGVVQGTTPTTFSPNNDVRRDQMASFIANAQTALGRDVSTTEDFFDDDEGNTHESKINVIASEGITIGRGADRAYDTASNVTREQMAAFLARKLDILVDADQIPPRFTGDPVVVDGVEDDQEVRAGEPITGEVTGDNIETVTVSGDCVEEGPVADEDTATEGIQFSIDTLEDAAAGECELTFTVSFTDSNRTQSFTRTVTIQAVPEATERPELISAEAEPTDETDGTQVRFVFDEEVTGRAPVANLFHVYRQDGTQLDGDEAVIEDGEDSVLVTFAGLTDPDHAADLTVATVDEGAVEDDEDLENPIGDAPLGEDSDNTTGFEPGVTEAPDLESVGNFRTNPDEDGETLVDFVFDENAFVVDEAGFSLVLTSGAAPIPCEAVANDGTATDLGDFTGDGTDTITVSCVNTAATGPITAAQVARGIVQEGTVSDEDPTNAAGAPTGDVGSLNPLQASDTPDGNNGDNPDLASATLTFGDDDASPTAGTITFTFDEAVTITDAGGFAAYDADGNRIEATDVEEGETGREVVATFEDLGSAVGATVEAGSVTEVTGAGTRTNQDDEEGVANSNTNPDVQTAGRTDNPDLTDVRVEDDDEGNAQAVFVFDEAIEFDAADAGELSLFLQDGTELECTTATADVANDASTTDADNEIVCTEFTGVDDDPTANDEDIEAAVVGTVDNGVAFGDDADANGNPEGAELVS